MSAIPGFWAIVPAGGAGTRLWPLSRASHPKFLHDLVGSGRTLIQDTVERLRPLADDRVVVVTGVSHADQVRSQVPELGLRGVIAEPSPRDSMAAIALAAAVIEAQDPLAVVGSFAADHVIPDVDAFHACVREAVAVATEGYLVTIGIEPTHPATGFGYIQMGERLDRHATARRVRRFVEKPDADTAAQYLESGRYRWNAGMFVARAGALLDLVERWHPEIADGVRTIAADRSRLDEIWPTLTKIPIDTAVAEPAADIGRVAVVPGTFRWDDVGDFASLGSLVPPAATGATVVGDSGNVRQVDSTGLIVANGGRMVAVVGLDDVVVVDTGDAVLVTARSRAQDVKQIVDLLKADDRADLT